MSMNNEGCPELVNNRKGNAVDCLPACTFSRARAGQGRLLTREDSRRHTSTSEDSKQYQVAPGPLQPTHKMMVMMVVMVLGCDDMIWARLGNRNYYSIQGMQSKETRGREGHSQPHPKVPIHSMLYLYTRRIALDSFWRGCEIGITVLDPSTD